MSELDEKLIEGHEYDGIQELDNDLPPWWVMLFVITIIFSVVYMGYYHVTDLGPSQAQEFEAEMAKYSKLETTSGKGKALYAKNCLACHGKQGQGLETIGAPQIAGQEDWYLTFQINDFHSDLRGINPKDQPGNTMRSIVKTALRNEHDVKAIVDYVSKLTPQKQASTLKGDLEKGKTLFATCIGCHGPTGLGNPLMKAPKLSGLNDWYIQRQLKNYKTGLRGGNLKDPMRNMMPMIMTPLSEKDILDLSSYIPTLNN